MRTGIITYHNAINYGAVLQAYALQQVLLGMGVQCDIIDYSCPAVDKQYKVKKISEYTRLKEYILDALSSYRLKRKKKEFKQFCAEYMLLSKKFDNISQENLEVYDALIVGSDQVFNPKNTAGDSSYLLNFESSSKKIAYAASVGNNEFLRLWKDKYNFDYVSLLKQFNSLSFREEATSSFVSDLLEGSYETTLDPVLLAGKDVWRKFQSDTNDEYIFVYNLGNIPLLVDYVKFVQKKTGLKVKAVNKDFKGDFLLNSCQNASSVSPAEFLKLLSGAKYVITDSFHGTAFSIIYHKNFVSVVNPHKENTNSRLVDLLNRLNLRERILTDADVLHNNPITTYADIDEKLQEMQHHSLDWLHDALNLKENDKQIFR